MTQSTVKINGRRFVITERRAGQVLDLIDFVKANEENDSARLKYFHVCKSICDAIQSTAMSFGWWQFIKRWLYNKITPAYLLATLSETELLSLYTSIAEMEGEKKKAIATASQTE